MTKDFPRVQPNERVAFIVATTADDPRYRQSEGAQPHPCDECGKTVMLARATQARLPMPVICLQCYTARHAPCQLRRF